MTMRDAFAHLHVASGFSLRYGASTPAALVERASALGQPALALTDRDGLYGAVRFVQACDEAGIAPVLGVDLAVGHGVDPTVGHRPANAVTGQGIQVGRANPVRGGADVDPRYPRVTVLARGQGAGVDPGVGWGRLCRLVTQTHLSGERGAPVSSAELIAEHAVDPRSGALALVVLLGPASDVGQALLARRPGRARQQGLTHVRGRPEQDHQSQRSAARVDGMFGNELCAADRGSAFTTEVGLGH